MIANASALVEPALNGRTKMDAAIEPRNAGFVGGSPETRKLPGFHTITFAGSVLEPEILAKKLGQNGSCSAGPGTSMTMR